MSAFEQIDLPMCTASKEYVTKICAVVHAHPPLNGMRGVYVNSIGGRAVQDAQRLRRFASHFMYCPHRRLYGRTATRN